MIFNYKTNLVSYLYLSSFSTCVTGLGLSAATSVSRAGGGSKCVLFFTGGSNLFQSSIYDEFIEEMESRDIDVYNVPFQYQISQDDIDELHSKYKYEYRSVNAMGHSSGCTTLLNQCCELNGIKDVFLLDPVNTKFSEKKWKVANFESLSFIHAMKSYQISFDPFGLPFIPIFKLTDENLDIDNELNMWTLEIDNYGHSDILNQPLSDFMHNARLSVGNKNRGVEVKQNYFNIILSFISTIIDK